MAWFDRMKSSVAEQRFVKPPVKVRIFLHPLRAVKVSATKQECRGGL